MRHACQERLPQVAASNEILSLEMCCAVFVHELANPLNTMFATVQILERALTTKGERESIDETITYTIQTLSSEINRLRSLLEEFRSLRMPFHLNLRPTSLAAEIRHVLAIESAHCAQHGIRIEQDVPSDLPLMMADADKLRQMLLNLCKNALEAMPNGGTLTVRGYKMERHLCLDVGDTGEGIPKQMQVFQPFLTKKPHGTGLGLPVAQLIVSAHGGTMTFTSEPQQGTIFQLRFPISG